VEGQSMAEKSNGFSLIRGSYLFGSASTTHLVLRIYSVIASAT